ncbi:MAG: response regulator [Limimaricola sp.]|uniref:response regulator n=1 Tax=Limimaricola sp. TaxID=2211665 RepID=UPI001D39AF82|nr:response regulator [Limimaricola sp.]MBI1416858.1 response regulator [Limimaricola sp.]
MLGPDRHPLKVLHVDDDDDVREIAQIAVEQIGGLLFRQFATGQAAIEAAADWNPDVLLLDVMMPEMTGPETLERLRSIPSLVDTTAIFLTAKVRKTDIHNLMSVGAAGVIVKPFDPILLATEIFDIWQNDQERRGLRERVIGFQRQ